MASMALTGTPGTGKTTVAKRLAPSWRALEVAELARRFGTGRPTPQGLVVDLEATARAWRAGRTALPDLVVGHLSHLLPIRDVVVLRCHPRELARRLARSGRGTERDRRANLVAEATDVVLAEAVGLRRRIYEIDTTGRTPGSLAREVALRLKTRGPASYGRVDWLGDAWVSEHLLDWSR